jgi:dUTP pyrophosphatase
MMQKKPQGSKELKSPQRPKVESPDVVAEKPEIKEVVEVTNKMRVKLTLPNAKAPIRVNTTDAGADLFSPIDVVIPPRGCHFINFGVIIELPKNTVGLIFARSGLGSIDGIVPRNAVGVIDEKYRGELGMMVKNDSNVMYKINAGDRVAQLVITPVLTPDIEVSEELDLTDDRNGGFGSTGK